MCKINNRGHIEFVKDTVRVIRNVENKRVYPIENKIHCCRSDILCKRGMCPYSWRSNADSRLGDFCMRYLGNDCIKLNYYRGCMVI